MKKQEIRTFDITNLKTRSEEDSQTQIVTGYAAVLIVQQNYGKA